MTVWPQRFPVWRILLRYHVIIRSIFLSITKSQGLLMGNSFSIRLYYLWLCNHKGSQFGEHFAKCNVFAKKERPSQMTTPPYRKDPNLRPMSIVRIFQALIFSISYWWHIVLYTGLRSTKVVEMKYKDGCCQIVLLSIVVFGLGLGMLLFLAWAGTYIYFVVLWEFFFWSRVWATYNDIRA